MARVERPQNQTSGRSAGRRLKTDSGRAPRKAFADQSPDDDTGGGRFGALRFCGRMLALFVLPVVLLFSLALGLGYFRLLQGPVSLKFLVEPVQQGIAAEFKGLEPKIDDVVVSLTDGGGLEFRLKNLQIAEDDGDLVVSAPLAAMHLAHGALWSGQFVPSRVEIIEPRVFVSYSKAGGVQLQFSPGASRGGGETAQPLSAQQDGISAPAPRLASAAADAAPQRIDLTQVVTQMTASARRGEGASSFLREVGLRDASVVLDYEGASSTWRVPQFSLDLDHRSDRSVISGVLQVASKAGPWAISFRTEETDASNQISILTSLRGFQPKVIGQAVPQFGFLKMFDLPLDGNGKVSLSSAGEILRAEVGLEVGSGNIDLTDVAGMPFPIDAGLLRATYDAGTKRIDIAPSAIKWGESSITIAGAIAPVADADTASDRWQFDLQAQKGLLSAPEFNIAPLPLERWQARGSVVPATGVVLVEQAVLKAGGGQIAFSGEIDTKTATPSSNVTGQISAMPVETLKVLWPRMVAPHARTWVGEQIKTGHVDGGTIKLLSGRHLAQEQPGALGDGHRLSMTLESRDIIAVPADGYPPITLPRALARLENNQFEVAMPEGTVRINDDVQLALKAGQFTASDINAANAAATVTFKLKTDLPGALEALRHPALSHLGGGGPDLKNAKGDVEGDFEIAFPLLTDLSASDIRVTGKARVSDGEAEKLFGGFDAQGAKIDVSISGRAIDARGELLLSGVLAKINWQRIFDVPADNQPPLRVTAVLDDADRKQLGLDASGSVLGEIPVELTIKNVDAERPDVHVRADLTNADLLLRNIAWRKPPGRGAYLESDIVQGGKYETELSNMTVVGDDLAIRGWAGFDAKRRLVAFEFPEFALNLVSRLNLSGKLSKKNIWDIAVVGQTYDGRAFFRSIYSVGQLSTEHPAENASQQGVDLSAKIDNVIGFEGVSLRKLDMTMSRRRGKLSALDARGVLDGGEPLVVKLARDASGKSRKLLADSTDAGQAFRLVGFYPNVQRGRVRLEVNLDGRGAAQKTGTLFVDKFAILGDPVVADIVSSADDSRPIIDGKSASTYKTVRQVIPFDRMRAPFSVGHGQFVLEDASLRGPVQGATLRGKVDYNRQSLNLGGTYIPAQALMNVFGGIPLIGDLLSGPRHEGIFGMTFAIQGPMKRPQVIVNPLSIVAPGIFREIFQLTPEAPRVQPLAPGRRGSNSSGGSAVRSSSAPAAAGGSGPGGSQRSRNDPAGGWSSQRVQ